MSDAISRVRLTVFGAVLILSTACAREGGSPPTAATPAPAVATAAAPSASAPAKTPATPAGKASAATPASDRVFVPGERFGAISRDSDEAALQAIYGKANVKRSEWEGAEGETVPATVVFEGGPDEFWVLWQDNAFKRPERVMVVGGNWHTDEGLHVGTPLAELRALNGGDFEFSGFDWDYGGFVGSWRKGKLARYAGNLFVALDREPREGEAEDRAIEGDQTVVSDHPGLEARGVKVARLDLGL